MNVAPHLTASGRMLGIEFPNGVRAPIPGLPIEIGSHELGLRRQAPAVGEHTAEILRETGLSVPEIEQLRVRGIVSWPEKVRPGQSVDDRGEP